MAKKFNLKIIEGNDVDSVFELEEGLRYEVRRMPPDGIPSNIDRKLALFLNDSEVSKLHASLTIVGGELVVNDLGSTNGVYINNKKITKSLAVAKDRIKIGSTIIMVFPLTDGDKDDRTFVGKESEHYSKQSHDFKKLAKIIDEDIVFEPDLKKQPPYMLASQPYQLFLDIVDSIPEKIIDNKYSAKELLDDYSFKVEIVSGENTGTVYHFYRRSIIVGRTKDLWLYDKSVSREHAEVSLQGPGVFKIKDLGSQNGTFINDQRVQTATFRDFDKIKLGDTVLSFSMTEQII